MFKKIIVIGCPGAGKSTFSKKLREKTGLPLYHLDMIWHRPDRTNVSREEFDDRLKQLICGERWIIDGHYARTLEMRLKACDTVFLLDLPTEECLAGVEARIGKPRDDMPWTETEFDSDFKRHILDFRQNKMPRAYELIDKYSAGKSIYIFHSREEANDFLGKMLNSL